MDQISNKFAVAAEEVKKLNSISNDAKGALYGLYKQSLEGDNQKPQPSFYQLTEKAKWSAWESQKGIKIIKGKSQEDSMKEYIQLVIDLAKEQDNQEIVDKLQ